MPRWRLETIKLVGAAIVAAMAAISLALALVHAANSAAQFADEASRNCRQIERLKDAIRSMFDEAQRRALQDGLNPAQRIAVRSYYAQQRAKFQSTKC